MRMTNKIMRNNAAYNINQNKILQDKLTNQMTNQSKIVRPSDDPVVAIRALRLRSNVTAITQYNEKNAKDAEQWLTLTADAMLSVDATLNKLYEKATTSADKYNTSDDLRILMSEMKQLTSEFYSCANVDYAGRFVFSGYRTDLPVTFTEEDMKDMKEHPVSFNIDEDFGYQDISRISYTDYTKVEEGLVPNPPSKYPTTAEGIDDVNSYEQAVKNTTMYRFRISYNNLDSLAKGGELRFTMPDGTNVVTKAEMEVEVDEDDNPITDEDGNPVLKTDKDGNPIAKRDEDGNLIVKTTPVDEDDNPVIEVREFGDQEEAYKAIADGTFTGIAYIPSSGELVFSEDLYYAKFNEKAFEEGKPFHVNYNKTTWQNGDINPVHYFRCIETKNVAAKNEEPDLRRTAYNTQRDQGRDQDIYYDVGYNQQIQVNTRADEIFTHDVQRDMDDFEHYLKQLQDIETVEKNLEAKRAGFPEGSDEYKDITERLEGVKKAFTYIRDNIHTKFENQITKYQQYMDDSRVAMTDNATRGSRLELVATRLTNQQATFKELQQDNEGIDITEVAVEMTSAELTYNAALMATGKIMQTNLMNYI